MAIGAARVPILLCALCAYLSACLATTTHKRSDSEYEMRRVQVSTKFVTTTERVKVGERQVTSVEKFPVLGPGSDIEDGSETTIYDERTTTSTEAVYEERKVRTSVPLYEWQRHEIDVNNYVYQTVYTSWVSMPYALFVGPILAFETVFMVLGGLSLGPMN